MKAALYIRVSTHHQIDKDSLPFQRQELINYAQYALGISDFEVFEDAGYSAKNTDRPAFQSMFNKIRLGEFSHLLVWKIDRISRNLKDFSDMYDELKKYSVTFISKNEQFDTSSAMGEAMLKIILVFAELERKLTAERVSSIMLSRAEKGLWNGANCPLGYIMPPDSKFPVVDVNEAKIVKYIFNTYEDTKSAFQVMKLLNQNMFKTKRGGEWTSKTVVDIIRNPFYKGTYRYNYRETARGKIKPEDEWIIIDDNHPAIISVEQWNKCNLIMDTNAERNTSEFRGNVHTHIFSNILKCAECGRPFIASKDRARKDGYAPSKYRCQSRMRALGCQSKMGNDDKIGNFVLTYLANFMRATNNINTHSSIESFEKELLSGDSLKKVKSLDKTYLQDTYMSVLYNQNKDVFYEQLDNLEGMESKLYDYELLIGQKEKLERALERLKKLYLFDEEGISEKEFLVQQKALKDELDATNKKLKHSSNHTSTSDITDLQKLSNFMLLTQLNNQEKIQLKELLERIDKGTLRNFIVSIIKEIIVKDGKVISILFHNGLINRFIY
ncbi:recombinase family protein [Niameybacter massiliensis]|uniref:Recombinase family protein n=1 Tax=Holtiella tumoricola TaxID=3018743 RepID=A0AA42DMQ0_9FIRM|nr:recombinase family protein [Holtiella tumoricola]MDA3731622.1 recombinase family protein [Holtiella tumoricola]